MCTGTGQSRNKYEMFFGKTEQKGPLRRPKAAWEDNIKVDPNEIVFVVD
jgi:hypothetical protein